MSSSSSKKPQRIDPIFIWTLFFLTLVGLLVSGGFNQVLAFFQPAPAAIPLFYPGDNNWDERFVMGSVDGFPAALAVDGNDLYVGGDFQFAGKTSLNGIGVWNQSAWRGLGSGLSNGSLPGNVQSIAIQGDNVYVSGYFDTAGANPGVPVDQIAVWSKTSETWSAMQGGLDRAASAMVIYNNNLYVGGSFSRAGGIQTRGLAFWDGSAWHEFGPVDNNGEIYSMAVDPATQRLYVAGDFSSIGGVSASSAAYWNGTTWTALGVNTNSVREIRVLNSQVYLLEGFYDNSNQSFSQVKHWNGSNWDVLSDPTPGSQWGLAVSPTQGIYVVGEIRRSSQGNDYSPYLARWNSGTTTWVEITPDSDKYIDRIFFAGTKLIAAGQFSRVGNLCTDHLASWDGTNWSAIGLASHAVYEGVEALAGPAADDLYLGGEFACVNGQPKPGVAHWNGRELEPVGNGLEGSVIDLVYHNSNVYAAGYFTAKGQAEVINLAKWNGTTWGPIASNDPAVAGIGVTAIAVSGNTLAIAERITQYPEPDTSQVWRLDLSTPAGAWVKVGDPADGPIQTLAIRGTEIFAGGSFEKFGQTATSAIARWDGSAWQPLGAGVGFSITGYTPVVNSIAISGSTVLAGGYFNRAGNISANSIARWDGSAWSSFGAGLDGNVYKVVFYGSDIYASGWHFYNLSSNLARWDGSAWSRLGQGVTNAVSYYGGTISDLAVFNGNVYATGWFTRAGAKPSVGFGIWRAPTLTGQVSDGTNGIGGVTILANDGHTVTTASDGTFSIANIAMGGSISALKAGYVFTPASLSVNKENVDLSIPNMNFSARQLSTATPKPTIAPTATVQPNKPAPVVSGMTPKNDTDPNIPASGIVGVVITGANFQPIPAVSLQGHPLNSIQYVSSTQLKAILPALATTGDYNLTVTNPDGQSGTLPNAYHVSALKPVVQQVGPSYGYNLYSNQLWVSGMGFTGDSLDASALHSVVTLTKAGTSRDLFTQFVRGSVLMAYIPAGLDEGTYSLTVKNPNNLTSQRIEAAYTSIAGTYDYLYPLNGLSIWQDPIALHLGETAKLGITLHRAGGGKDNNLTGLEVDFYVNDEKVPGNKLGRVTFGAIAPNSDASSQVAAWDWHPTAAGEYNLIAVFDPDGDLPKTGNYPNLQISLPFHQTLRVLPKIADTTPPTIQQFWINMGGQKTTSEAEVLLTTHAQDMGQSSSGLASLYYVESVYSQSAGGWTQVNSSGWIPYSASANDYKWMLSAGSGMKVLQVWAADFAGNVSKQPASEWINFVPDNETIEKDMTRAYRFSLPAGQRVTASLTTGSGDADLYLWTVQAGKNVLSGFSDQDATQGGSKLLDEFCYANAGSQKTDLQYEVYGFAASTYSLKFKFENQSTCPEPTAPRATDTSGKVTRDTDNLLPMVNLDVQPVQKVSVPPPPVSTTTYYVYLSSLYKAVFYPLSGKISAPNGAGVSGITLRLNSGETVTSGSDGTYRFEALTSGSYTITPQSGQYTFSPVSRTLTLSGPSAGINFTAQSNPAELIQNGGFESASAWSFLATTKDAEYVTGSAHSGSRSMQIGLLSGTNLNGYSSIHQTVSIPADAASALLGFWMASYTTESTTFNLSSEPSLTGLDAATSVEDAQVVLITNSSGTTLRNLFTGRRNDHNWVYQSYDLSDFAGQTIKVQFKVVNNGDGGITGMRVDDVSLLIER